MLNYDQLLSQLVNYDQKNDAYHAAEDEHADFLEWVAIEWPGDDEIQGADESTAHYLERLVIRVSLIK